MRGLAVAWVCLVPVPVLYAVTAMLSTSLSSSLYHGHQQGGEIPTNTLLSVVGFHPTWCPIHIFLVPRVPGRLAEWVRQTPQSSIIVLHRRHH